MEETNNGINANTQIVFTLKSFITTILAILGIFVGFHKLVISPSIEDQKNQIKSVQIEMNGKFDKMNDQLIQMTNGIGSINGNIEGINNRFKDLHQVRSTEGGSFSPNN